MNRALIAAILLSAGCSGSGGQDAQRPDAPADHDAHAMDHDAHAGMDHDAHAGMNHEALPAAETVPGASLHQLEVPLTSHAGEPIDWSGFRGGPVLVSMIYTSCSTACPMIVAEVMRIHEAAGVPNAKVLLVSMDPERDTPEALAAMKAKHDLGPEWTLAHSDDAGTRMVSAALGVRYRKLPSGDFNHSQVIALLDGDGVIAARAESLGPQRDVVIAGLKTLAR